MRAHDISPGTRFARLIVIAETVKMPSGGRRFLCQCDCGSETAVQLCHLLSGAIRSCGCFRDERTRERTLGHGFNTTHGQSHQPEYQTWVSMKHRCYNPHAEGFEYYGGRGIQVCDEWRTSFAAFFKELGPRPSATHSIDRIDNDGHYEPGNVRWASKREQASNRRPETHSEAKAAAARRNGKLGWPRKSVSLTSDHR